MPFQYRESDNSPAVGSISGLMLRRGEIAAQQAQQIAAAQARAAEVSGNAYAGAAQNIGQSVSGAIQQATDPRRKMEALQAQQLQAQAADQQQVRAGQRQVDTLMAGDTLSLGAAGPRQESYLTPEGLWDVKKLQQALASSGRGHLAPELLKGAEGINASILKSQETEQQHAQQQALLVGDLAHGAIQLHQAVNMPLLGAMDFAVQPALATKRIKPEEYQQVRAQIAGLPPEQQVAALNAFRDQAAKLDKGENLSEGAIHADRYGRTVATGGAKPPTESELAVRAANGDRAAIAAMAILKPAPNRTAEMDDQRYRDIQAKQLQGIPVAPPDLAWAKGYEKQKTLGVDTSASAAADRQAASITAATAQQARAQGFTEAQAGRKELTEKVEAPYRQAQQSAQELRDLVHAAQGGNKEAASLQSLQATMSVVRANGLNRLNQAEMKLPEGAGSVWDRIAGKVGKLASGQPIDASLQKDLLELSDLIEKGAYNRYVASHHDVTTRYKLTDEKPASGPAPSTVKMRAPNGQVKDVAAGEVEHYKTLGATVVK